jgi:hypothetical protein
MPRLDFDGTRPSERDFPCRAGGARPACYLVIQHQSDSDPPAPLRTLWYAVLYWERPWRACPSRHQRGELLQGQGDSPLP